MLIHVKAKEQTVRANYVIVLSMQNAHPYFEWNRPLGYRQFFSREMKTRQENIYFKLGLANLRCVFAKLLMYEHYSYKKGV